MKEALSDSIESYLGHLASLGTSKSHLKANRSCLRRVLTVVGNILTENVHEGHIDAYFTEASKTRSAASLSIDTSTLRSFFRWAIRTKRAGRSGNPMEDRKAPRAQSRPWRGFHVSKVPGLLDAARHPRDRIVLALAVYALGRSVEFTILRIGDVDLAAGQIAYTITKTRKSDLIPICEELDEELRRWLTVYTELAGPLDPSWYLTPAKTPPRPGGNRIVDPLNAKLVPTRRMARPYLIAQSALARIGHPVVDGNGKPLNEGMHTIRRSMARALHDQLRDEGDPNPVETVRAMLNHATEAQTRHYIGLETNRVHRDKRVKGRLMFPGLRGGNVSELDTFRQQKEAAGSDG